MRTYINEYGITVVEADEDKLLCKGDCIAKYILLGKNDSIENWTEIEAAIEDYEAPIAELGVKEESL